MDKDYIELSQFAKKVKRSESTIKRRCAEMPIIKKENNKFLVLKGTRYPLKIRSYKQITDDFDRRRILLKAISEEKYIDCDMLGVYQEIFENYLRDLLNANLIYKNSLPNFYGANAYNCTDKGATIAKLRKEQARIEISHEIASVAGTFIGTVISKIKENIS